MAGCLALLDKFGIPYRYETSSAHRNPERTKNLAESARDEGFRVIIAAAGMAAALPGVIASYTTLPVIGVPMPGSALGGIDALCSIVQMPAGVPVAGVGLDNGENAALLAAEILALYDKKIEKKLIQYRKHRKG